MLSFSEVLFSVEELLFPEFELLSEVEEEFEPDEDYDERKAERDTKAVIEFANSEEFQELVKSL